jgi:hypothetical protein
MARLEYAIFAAHSLGSGAWRSAADTVDTQMCHEVFEDAVVRRLDARILVIRPSPCVAGDVRGMLMRAGVWRFTLLADPMPRRWLGRWAVPP